MAKLRKTQTEKLKAYLKENKINVVSIQEADKIIKKVLHSKKK